MQEQEDPPQAVVELVRVEKSYHLGSVLVPVIKGINLIVRPACFSVLLGPSGSGKTTLLNLMGCVDKPDQGEVVVANCQVGALDDDALSDFRGETIGAPASKRGARVQRLLEAVGLGDKAKNLPGQLSGGQRQRVAIARALARKPKLVIADEPTANLDSATGAAILALMRSMVDRYAISFLFSSHDPEVIKAADDTIFLSDGVIQSVRRKGAVGLA